MGIYPGMNITGYGCLDFGAGEPRIVEAGTVRPGTAKVPLPDRLVQLHADLAELITELKPDLVAVEKLYSHYAHPRTAIIMGHARGVVLLAAAQAGVAVADLPATNIKKSLTGNGHASKLQMQRSIQAVFKLKALPSPPDVADALAVALCAGKNVVH